MTRRHPRMCLFGFGWRPTILKGSNPKKTQKGAWLGIFQTNWQNYKIAIFSAGNIGSTSNFDRVIEPHSWLRGWSRITENCELRLIITKFTFKMTDSRLSMDRFGRNLGGSIPSCSRHVLHCHCDGRCLATAHWTLSSYGRLEAERVNEFW